MTLSFWINCGQLLEHRRTRCWKDRASLVAVLNNRARYSFNRFASWAWHARINRCKKPFNLFIDAWTEMHTYSSLHVLPAHQISVHVFERKVCMCTHTLCICARLSLQMQKDPQFNPRTDQRDGITINQVHFDIAFDRPHLQRVSCTFELWTMTCLCSFPTISTELIHIHIAQALYVPVENAAGKVLCIW